MHQSLTSHIHSSLVRTARVTWVPLCCNAVLELVFRSDSISRKVFPGTRIRESGVRGIRVYIHILTFNLFFRKSLDDKHQPHAPRVSHDFLSLLRSLLSSRSLLSLRAYFSCHTFFPRTIEKNIGKRKKSILISQLFGRLSFAFFHRLGEISFALSVIFPFFFLPFRVRMCSRSTATRASPAASRVSADAGG